MRIFAATGILVAAAALGGCGNSGPAAPPPAAAERGIFISSGDCAESEKLTLDQCGQAIDGAVALHQNRAPSFPTIDACNAASGQDHCAKGVDGHYHPNIEAFLITFGQRPNALPLYGTADGSAGFTGLDKQKYMLGGVGYSVSDSAQAIANENAKRS